MVTRVVKKNHDILSDASSHRREIGNPMGEFGIIPVRLFLKDDVVWHGTLFQRNEVIDSTMQHNIWVKLDTSIDEDEIRMKDPRVLSMEVLTPERKYQGSVDPCAWM